MVLYTTSILFHYKKKTMKQLYNLFVQIDIFINLTTLKYYLQINVITVKSSQLIYVFILGHTIFWNVVERHLKLLTNLLTFM